MRGKNVTDSYYMDFSLLTTKTIFMYNIKNICIYIVSREV